MLRLIGLGGEIFAIKLVGVLHRSLEVMLTSLSSSSCVETLGEGEEAGVGLLSVLCENGTDLDLGIVFDLLWLHRYKG